MFEKRFFVLAPSYHGATLLSKLLNAHPDVTSLGDTMPSNEFDQICGCGELVSACPFWRHVKYETNAAIYSQQTRSMMPRYPKESGGFAGRLAYSDFLSFWATPSVLAKLHDKKTLQRFYTECETFVEAVYRHTPSPGKVFVDGVKYLSRVEALTAAGNTIDGIIHVYRDPADFVASSARNTGRAGPLGILEHALRYRLYHSRARQVEARHPALVLSYEQLSRDVDKELKRLFEHIGVEPLNLAQLRKNFEQPWHFMGNSSLLNFDGQIRTSKNSMSSPSQFMARVIGGASS